MRNIAQNSIAVWASLPQTGGPFGNLLSTAILALFSVIMNNEAFLAWGWRIPFLLSAILVFVGLYVRLQVEESPLFIASRARDAVQKRKIPVIEAFRRYKPSILIAMLLRIGENTGFYMFTTFLIVYSTQILNTEKAVVLNAITIGSVFQVLGLLQPGHSLTGSDAAQQLYSAWLGLRFGSFFL